MTPHAIRVFDDVVPLPDDYRAAVLLRDFHDIPTGLTVFHGMSEVGPTPLSAMIEDAFPVKVTTAFFRLSPEGQEEPNYIHTDADMGEWSGILYLNPDPPLGDGTTFFKSKKTGAIQSEATSQEEKTAEWLAWRDVNLWEPWHHVPAVYNRLVLFPSAYFHGRALYDNYGKDSSDSRLIQLCFGTGTLPCV